MDYRLYIRKRSTRNQDGTETRYPWRELDLGDERPAMTYQINDLNELKDRNATYSQKIKLPRSVTNNQALGFIENFDVIAEPAYTPLEVKLECESAPISPAGALLYIDTVGQYIECQIVSSVSDLFKRMETTGMAHDDWDRYTYSLQNYNWDRDSPNDTNSVKHRWALIRPYQGGRISPPVADLGIRTVFMYGNIMPCVQFYDLAKFTFRGHGFKMITDLENDIEAMLDYIPCANPTTEDELGFGGGPEANWSGDVSIPRYTNQNDPFKPPTLSDDLELTRLGAGLSGSRNMIFIAPNPGKYRVSIQMSADTEFNENQYQMSWETRRHIGDPVTGTAIALDSETVVSTYSSSAGRYGYSYESDDIQLGIGDGLEVVLTSRGENRTTIWVNVLVHIYSVGTGFEIGSHSNLIPATGFKSNLEIIKTYLQTYGLLIDIKRYTSPVDDEMWRMPLIEGEVHCYSFNEPYRRRAAGQVADWSDKLVLDRTNAHQFSIGPYGQKNYINFAENTADRVTGRVIIYVNNETLEREKDLFTLPLEAGADISYGQTAVASIPVLASEVEEISEERQITHWLWAGAKPHLVRISEDIISVAIVQGNNYGTDELGYPNGENSSRVATTRLPSYIEQRYARLQGMLTNAKMIKAKFNLNVLDIEQLDFFTPVWVEFFGAYFYISKINNFVAGKPTTVELIKM